MSLISHSHKFIFSHVEKTGGKSVQAVLEPYAKEWWKSEDVEYVKGVNKTHPKLHELIKYCKFDTSKYFKFAFIRDPYERLWSAYNFFRQNEDFRKTDYDTYKQAQMKFQKWIYFQAVRPMSVFLKCDGKVAVDHVGICDSTMGEQFKEICHKIGLPELELPHINSSIHGEAKYTNKMKEYIKEKYAEDFKLWDIYNTKKN